MQRDWSSGEADLPVVVSPDTPGEGCLTPQGPAVPEHLDNVHLNSINFSPFA